MPKTTYIILEFRFMEISLQHHLGTRQTLSMSSCSWKSLSGKHHYMFSSPKTLPWAFIVDQCQTLIDLASISELKPKSAS